MWPFDRKERQYNEQFQERPRNAKEVKSDQREHKEDIKYDKQINNAVQKFLKRTDEDTKLKIHHRIGIDMCLRDEFEHLGNPDDI